LKKRYFAFALLMVGAFNLQAQQVPHFTQYMFQGIFQNPAYTGRFDYAEAAMFYRTQWQGMAGAPESFGAVFNTPIGRESVAIGGTVLRHTIGLTEQTHFNANFQYRMMTGKQSLLSFGLSLGGVQSRWDESKLRLHDDISLDPIFLNASQNTFQPDVGVGLMWQQMASGTTVGLAVRHLVNPGEVISEIGAPAQLSPHWFLQLSQNLGKGELLFIPTALVKYTANAPVQADVGMRAEWREKFWIGASYRTEDAVSIMSGIALGGGEKRNRYRLGYAFDFTTSKLMTYNNGGHELVLIIDLFKGDLIPCPDFKTFDPFKKIRDKK